MHARTQRSCVVSGRSSADRLSTRWRRSLQVTQGSHASFTAAKRDRDAWHSGDGTAIPYQRLHRSRSDPTSPRRPAHAAIWKVAYPPSDGLCNGGSAGRAPAASTAGQRLLSDRRFCWVERQMNAVPLPTVCTAATAVALSIAPVAVVGVPRWHRVSARTAHAGP
jgi:hypothetical protein